VATVLRALVLLILLAPIPTMAASIKISPIGVEVVAPSSAGTINITNLDAQSVDLQLRMFKWSQQAGADILAETSDVIPSPPAAALAPQETLTVRFLRVTKTPMLVEEAYRLIIDELPKPANARSTGQGFDMLLRASVPIFFQPSRSAAEAKWEVWTQNGTVTVRVSNSGTRHLRLAKLALDTTSGKFAFGDGLVGYVLPGQAASFSLPLAKGKDLSGSAHLTAEDDNRAIEEIVPIHIR
jgi:fimbrial chaperone protein